MRMETDQPNSAPETPPSEQSTRVRKALRKIDREFVEQGAKRVTEADVKEIVDKADEIEARFDRDGPLGRFYEDGRLLLALVKDYWRGEYRRLPFWTIAAVTFTLLYVFNPLDLLPDALPVVGLLDDAAVISMCLLCVEQDLHDYKAWRTARSLPDAEDETE